MSNPRQVFDQEAPYGDVLECAGLQDGDVYTGAVWMADDEEYRPFIAHYHSAGFVPVDAIGEHRFVTVEEFLDAMVVARYQHYICWDNQHRKASRKLAASLIRSYFNLGELRELNDYGYEIAEVLDLSTRVIWGPIVNDVINYG
jgi:hypothetical protein